MSASIPVLFVCILQYEEILRPKARWGRHRRVAKRGMALLKAIAADPTARSVNGPPPSAPTDARFRARCTRLRPTGW